MHKEITFFIFYSNWKTKFSDEKDETGGLIRTCSTDILVTKCEGSCNSQVQPSVKTSTGFLKVK